VAPTPVKVAPAPTARAVIMPRTGASIIGEVILGLVLIAAGIVVLVAALRLRST
jgi:hypothetical protein